MYLLRWAYVFEIFSFKEIGFVRMMKIWRLGDWGQKTAKQNLPPVYYWVKCSHCKRRELAWTHFPDPYICCDGSFWMAEYIRTRILCAWGKMKIGHCLQIWDIKQGWSLDIKQGLVKGQYFWVRCTSCGKRDLITLVSKPNCGCSLYFGLERPRCVVTICA